MATHITAIGFWLPSNQSSFFHARNPSDSKELFAEILNNHQFPVVPNHLNDRVLPRLLSVLPSKHYKEVFPIFQPKDIHADPIGAVFIADVAKIKEQLGCTVALQDLVFIINSAGFYMWLGAYASSHSDKRTAEAQAEEQAVRDCMHKHVFDIIGGDFYSHESGYSSTVPIQLLPIPTGQPSLPAMETLEDYRDTHKGILTFNQINTILEGLFNANFDPNIFFYAEKDPQKARALQQRYSLGAFINLILADISVETVIAKYDNPQTEATKHHSKHQLEHDTQLESHKSLSFQEVGDTLKVLLNVAETTKNRFDAAHILYRGVMQNSSYSHILRVFLRATADTTLQQMKGRIERCRRALLDEMLRITHRREPLVQAEPPPRDIDAGIDKVNETQLRGYMMVISAKLPLISNVEIYIREMCDEYNIRQGRQDSSSIAYHAWHSLLASIDTDIKRLDAAIQQAQIDRQLFEEEQIRKEEETIAEINRLGVVEEEEEPFIGQEYLERFELISTTFVAIIGFAQSLPLFISVFKNRSAFLGDLPAIATALIVSLGMAGAFYWIFTNISRTVKRRSKRTQQDDKQFYYEMDIHVDSALTGSAARNLLDGAFSHLTISKAGRRSQHVARQDPVRITELRRSSYRVERLEDDSAMHKVYLRAKFEIDRGPSKEPLQLKANLVYEVYFHRPTSDHSYILRDLRFVSDKAAKLTTDDILAIKRLVAGQFVNAVLAPEAGILFSHDAGVVDALFTMNIYQSDAPTGQLSVVRSA